jgi:hypothetical protein
MNYYVENSKTSMSRNIVLLVLLTASSLTGLAQRGTELPGQEREEQERRKYATPESKFKDLQNRVKNGSNFNTTELNATQKKFIKELTLPTASELMSIGATDQEGVRAFTLLSERSCKRYTDDKVLIQQYRTPCLDLTLPGHGEEFSFRKETYVSAGQSDLSIADNFLESRGNAVHTILTDLGDVPLLEVGLDDPNKIGFILDFVPATTVREFDTQAGMLNKGTQQNGRRFADRATVIEGHTYVLRSIAYGGKLEVVYVLPDSKVRFDLLKSDKRSDNVIAFRVLHRGTDGSVRILWRKLRQMPSPKINFPELVIQSPNVTTRITVIQ